MFKVHCKSSYQLYAGTGLQSSRTCQAVLQPMAGLAWVVQRQCLQAVWETGPGCTQVLTCPQSLYTKPLNGTSVCASDTQLAWKAQMYTELQTCFKSTMLTHDYALMCSSTEVSHIACSCALIATVRHQYGHPAQVPKSERIVLTLNRTCTPPAIQVIAL